MADKSAIEWTDATWTPIRARYWEVQNDGSGKERIGWHCEHASEGCRNCYAEGFNRRLGTGLDFKPGELYREEKRGYNNGEVKLFLDEEMLTAPLRWKKPRMIFVCSMTDLFADFVPDEWIDKMFAIMALAPQHTFQCLTKRARRMREYFAARTEGDPWAEAADAIADMIGMEEHPHVLEPRDIPLRNVWLGVSAERQQEADARVPELLANPAAVRFVSAEPLLGPIDFTTICTGWHFIDALAGRKYHDAPGGATEPCERLDWIIVGGESGPGARPMHPAWARSIQRESLLWNVPFFFKQWGAWVSASCQEGAPIEWHEFPDGACVKRLAGGKKAAGRLLDGIEHNAMPASFSVRDLL